MTVINNPDQYIDKIQKFCEDEEFPIKITIECKKADGGDVAFDYEIADATLGFVYSSDKRIKSFIEALRSIALDLSDISRAGGSNEQSR